MWYFLALILMLVGCVATPTETPKEPYSFGLSLPASDTDESPDRLIDINDLVGLRDIGSLGEGFSLSPDGKKIAFLLRRANTDTDSYDVGWFVAEIASNAAPLYVGDGGERFLLGEIVRHSSGAFETLEAKWSPDGKWIAYRKKADGEIQIWRASVDGMVEEKLTSNVADVLKFEWSDDDDKIYFDVLVPSRVDYSESLRRESAGGYLFDWRFRPAVSSAPILRQGLAKSLRGEAAPALHFVYDFSLKAELVDTDISNRTGPPVQDELKKMLGVGELRDVRNVVRRGGNFAWLENIAPQMYKGPIPPVTVGRRITNQTQVAELCDAKECSGFVTDVWLDAASGEVYFLRREGKGFGKMVFYAWSANGEVRTVLKNDEWYEDCDFAHGRLICLADGWKTPRRIVSINVNDGSVDTIIDPNPEFQSLKLSHVEQLAWKDRFGADVIGHLVYPVDYVEGERYPLIIVQYRSRGFLRGGVGDEYPIHVFAANGFMVLSYDSPSSWDMLAKEPDIFRREAESWGEEFRERESDLSAIENAIEILDMRGMVDTTRIGITGLSNGAESVWYAMMHSDRFAAAIASSGGWTPSAYYLVPAATRRLYYNQAAGLQAPGHGADERWRRISPEFHAENIDTPILIHVADSELLSAIPPHEALKDVGKPVEMYVFPEEYHVKVQPKHRAAIYERNIDWMNFWLRDLESQDPAKAAQYTRWRNMQEVRCTQIGNTDLPSYCDMISN